MVFGAVRQGDTLHVTLAAEKPWRGRLLFDVPRHKTVLHLPIDWPRINQFPEWFTVEQGRVYTWQPQEGPTAHYKGRTLVRGVRVEVQAGQTRRVSVRPQVK